MLDLLRRYQRYFLWVITIMVMISFSFFGTYGVMEQRLPADPIAFHTVGGEEVRQSQLRAMIEFLSSDKTDARLLGRGNIFNDGVIANDFLQTSLGVQLAEGFSDNLQPDLQARLTRERRAQFYQHPQAPFLSFETVWGYFIPQTTKALSLLRQGNNPLDQEAFRARMQLYTDQRAFPPQELKRVLLHQERQYEWLDHDPSLEYADLSMFGYHTLEDWFGPQFIRVVAEFILNTASIAQQRGYQVTSEEAMADLMQQVEKTYKQLTRGEQKASTWQIYFEQQLTRLGLNETQLVDVWRNVLLFRRLFDGVAYALFLDPLSFEDFSRYALTRVEGFRYTLPQELWIPSESVLQEFETYLDLVAERQSDSPLAIPTYWKEPQALLKQYPELVQKRYRVSVSEVTSRHLQAQVGLQEMWDWQTSSVHWPKLAEAFPEIALQPAQTLKERLAILDSLPKSTRSRIDTMARSALICEHPERLDNALKQAPEHIELWTLPFAGKIEQLPEVTEPSQLIALLDRAPIGGEISPSLERYSPSGDVFYRIGLLEPPSALEVVPFSTAKRSQALKEALQKRLEAYWVQVRALHPTLFKQENGSWRTFEESQGAVAELYFKPLFDALQQEYQTYLGKKSTEETPSRNRLAAFRLYPYVQSIAKQIEASPSQEGRWVKSTPLTPEKTAQERSLAAQPVRDQFLLLKQPFHRLRRDHNETTEEEKLFEIGEGEWSALFATPKGAIDFFHILKTGVEDPTTTILEQMNQVRHALKQEAQGLLMSSLLQDLALKERAHSTAPSREPSGK